MKAWLYPGARVVCVDVDTAGKYIRPGSERKFVQRCELTLGSVYTVRWVGVVSDPDLEPYLGVRLIGFREEATSTPFRASRFGPITTNQVNAMVSLMKKAVREQKVSA